jgi:hypothetical protein
VFVILLKYYAKQNYSVLSQVNSLSGKVQSCWNRLFFLDELRHIIGSETTRRGLLRLFELLQNETLNRRFVYIVIEALLIKLFRPNDLHLIFEKLYSQSQRVKEEYRRRIFEQEHYHSSILVNQQHHRESNQRPYYLNRLLIRTDDHVGLQRSNSIQQEKTLPRSLSKISK